MIVLCEQRERIRELEHTIEYLRNRLRTGLFAWRFDCHMKVSPSCLRTSRALERWHDFYLDKVDRCYRKLNPYDRVLIRLVQAQIQLVTRRFELGLRRTIRFLAIANCSRMTFVIID